MYNELRNHEKSDNVKWIAAFVSIALLCVGVIAALIPAYSHTSKDSTNVAYTSVVSNEEDVFELQGVEGIRLMSASAITVSGDTLTQTVSATVLPSTATNKLVDWTVSWSNPEGDFESGKTVTDYVTVTPASNGSTTATITCHQAFPDASVIVTVTTRAGHFSASIAVSYIGIPSVMQIADNGEFDASGRMAARSQATTNFAIELSNIFDVVTDTYLSDYADFELVSVEAVGSFTCSGKTFNSVLNMWVNSGQDKTINLADIMAGRFTAAIVNNELQIAAGDPIESYSFTETIDGSSTGLPTTTNIYNYASGVENCYFVVTIRDNYTGLIATANMYISCEASGVTVSTETLLF